MGSAILLYCPLETKIRYATIMLSWENISISNSILFSFDKEIDQYVTMNIEKIFTTKSSLNTHIKILKNLIIQFLK